MLEYDNQLPQKYLQGEPFDMFSKESIKNNYYVNIGEYLETSSENVFFLRNYNSMTIVYRNKKTGHLIGGNDANFKAKEFPPIAFPKATYGDYFISIYFPTAKDYDYLKDSQMISAEDKEKIKQIKDKDNPILVYFKLKAF